MKGNLWNIILFCLIFILQILICNYVDVGAYVYICILPLIIIGIPMTININITLLAAFGIGLLLDMFAGGVMGLNAASATMLAAVKGPVFRNAVNKEHGANADVPSIRKIGLNKYIIYVALCSLIYLTTYTLLECISLRPFMFIALRILISVVIDTFLIVIISNSIIDRE